MEVNRLRDDRRVKVLLDANFLLLPFQKHIDIYEEIPKLLERRVLFVVPTPVWKELERMATDERRELSRMARACLELAEKKCILVESELKADDSLLDLAKKLGGIVATNDSELRKRVSDEGIPVICLRANKRLVLFGEIV